MIRCTSSGVTTTSAGVDDGEREEDADQPRCGRANPSTRRTVPRSIRLSTTLRSVRRCRHGGPIPPVHSADTPVLPVPVGGSAPISGGQLAEPAHLRLPLEPPLLVEVAVARALQQRLGLGDRTRHRRGQGARRGPPPSRRARPRDDGGAPGRCARPRRRRPSARWRRSPVPWRSQRSRPAALFPSGRGPGRARTPSWRTGRRRRPPAGRRRGPAGSPRRWRSPARGDRDEARVAQPGEALLVLVDGRRDLLVVEASSRRRSPRLPVAGVEHRAVEAGREAVAPPRTTTTRTSSGSAPDLARAPATSPGSARCAPRAGPA